jgi:hypothetical protein
MGVPVPTPGRGMVYEGIGTGMAKFTWGLPLSHLNDLYVKLEKCAFEQQEIEYLGVIIGKGHLKMDPKKLKGVVDYARPRNPTEV